jgi:hypothetical protein
MATVNYSLKDPTEVLDADMTRADIVAILKCLKFYDRHCLIGLDRPVRDYLISMLTDHRR